DSFVVSLLFLFTGFAIIIYLNQTSWQPRERDYAYVGSFYAFAAWIGLGVIAVFNGLKNFLTAKTALIVASSVSALSPLLLYTQNLDDHNRHGRTVARDVAVDFLESCAPNAILFTYADNDTFPLWYAQEVLGVRRDVRIVCLSLLRSDWYIDQAKKKQYTSDPLPVSWDHWSYRDGTRDYMNIFEDSEDTLDLRYVDEKMTSADPADRFLSTYGDTLNYIPTRNVFLPVNKKEFMKSSTLEASQEKNIADTVFFRLRGNYLLKDQEIVLDILAHNDWKRPVYFAMNMPLTCYAGLDDYLQLEGLAYRFVPVKNPRPDGDFQSRPLVNLQKCYDLVMNKFGWGGISDLSVYADETSQRMFSDYLRGSCSMIATALAEEGKSKEALGVIRKCVSGIPGEQDAPDLAWDEMVNAAYLAGDAALAEKLAEEGFDEYERCVIWYGTLPRLPGDFSDKKNGMFTLADYAMNYGDSTLYNDFCRRMKAFRFQVPVPDAETDDNDSVTDDSMK
ncbi:MAG TPA: hypothetical protein VFU15_01675, partial [Bacteroidia bacterium]|nr:hypothetical protein [Bacteroidia bacterium]